MNGPAAILGEIVRRSEDEQIIGVDLPTLVQRLLLFENVVVKSNGLTEVPDLVRAFGKIGFLHLLNSGVLKLSCEYTTIIGDPVHNGVRELPLCHFTFGTADVGDRERVLRSALRNLQGIPGLKNDERSAMEEDILRVLVRPPSDYGSQLLGQFENDLRNNSPSLVAAIKNQLKVQLNSADVPFEAHVEEKRERIFYLRNNFQPVFGISDEKTHEILSRSVFGVAHLNQRLADMTAYTAISGFAESEAPLLFGKLANIVAPQNPRRMEEEFKRVIRIANLPNVLPSSKIDVEGLLKARDSAECKEFRAWLATLPSVSDSEIEEKINGVRNRVAAILTSGPAKIARFATATVIGLIPGYGLVAGPAAGAIDSFLIDRLLPVSGAFAFLIKTYPSLFTSA